jgi:hypothetical protein
LYFDADDIELVYQRLHAAGVEFIEGAISGQQDLKGFDRSSGHD